MSGGWHGVQAGVGEIGSRRPARNLQSERAFSVADLGTSTEGIARSATCCAGCAAPAPVRACGGSVAGDGACVE